MRSRFRLIGVLGGMGPAATVDFLGKIVAATPAEVDQDHVPVVAYSVPQIPNRVEAVARGDDAPFEPMLAGIRTLERAGAEAIAIACNTAHVWHGRLAAETPIPILHIADAVAAELRAGGPIERLGIAATRATIAARIYHDRLAAAVPQLIEPDDATQQLIDRAISAVKAAESNETARLAAEDVARRLADRGADRILLGCTELPVALARSRWLAHCVDATDALARACVAFSRGFSQARGGAPSRGAASGSLPE